MPKKKKKKSWKENQQERQIKQRNAQAAYEIQKKKLAKRKPRQWPKGKIVLVIFMIAIILGVYAIWQYTTEPITQIPLTFIYIRADGSVDPSNASISNVDNSYYTFTADIYGSIVIERDNIVVDGRNYVLQGHSTRNATGIDLSARTNVTITNLELKNFGYGVYLYSATDNVVSQNDLRYNNYGIELDYSSNNAVYENTITNSEGAIGLSESEDNTITKNSLDSNTYSISVTSSSNNNISENTITNSEGAIALYQSDSNVITENYLEQNMYGISLTVCSDNSISNNSAVACSYAVAISQASDNIIEENYLGGNNYGVQVTYSSDNILFHNSFVFNTYQVSSSDSVNVWDNGYSNGGNFWADYQILYPDAEEVDGSGKWDTPYVIDEYNQDNYPLLNG